MSPECVQPYVKAQKNDDRDAEAIAEAATRPTMRFVDLKTWRAKNTRTHRYADAPPSTRSARRRMDCSDQPGSSDPIDKSGGSQLFQHCRFVMPDQSEAGAQAPIVGLQRKRGIALELNKRKRPSFLASKISDVYARGRSKFLSSNLLDRIIFPSAGSQLT
jgi:hypothetical protein